MKTMKFKIWDSKLKSFREGDYSLGVESGEVRGIYGEKFPDFVPLLFTGFTDKKNKEIYDGWILSDEVETDEGIVKSKCQVFWNEFTGSWHLDNSFEQDKSCSTELWIELNDFEYEIVGNVYELTPD